MPNLIFSDYRPKSDLYQDLVECNKEKEWDFLEHFVLQHTGTDNKFISYEKLWNRFKAYCKNNNYNIDNLSSRRFAFQFNRTIVKQLTDQEKYVKAIEKETFNNKRGNSFNFKKLREYFQIDESKTNLYRNDSDDSDCEY